MSRSSEIWDALVEMFGEPRMASARSFRGKMVRDYVEAGYTPDELRLAAKEYRREWPHVTLTAAALYKWADEFLARARPVAKPTPLRVVEPLTVPPPVETLEAMKALRLKEIG